MVAPVQPEGDVSSATGRARTPEPWMALSESWTSGPRVAREETRAPREALPKSWAPHRGRPKQATKELRKAWRSNHLGSRSDHQPPYEGRSDRLGSRSDHQPLFQGRSVRQPMFRARSNRPDMRADYQRWKGRRNMGRRQWCGHGSRTGGVILQKKCLNR
jgi:hypothetical protein